MKESQYQIMLALAVYIYLQFRVHLVLLLHGQRIRAQHWLLGAQHLAPRIELVQSLLCAALQIGKVPFFAGLEYEQHAFHFLGVLARAHIVKVEVADGDLVFLQESAFGHERQLVADRWAFGNVGKVHGCVWLLV